MVYAASLLFMLGLIFLGIRSFQNTSASVTAARPAGRAGVTGSSLIVLSCLLVIGAGLLGRQPVAQVPLSGDFGMASAVEKSNANATSKIMATGSDLNNAASVGGKAPIETQPPALKNTAVANDVKSGAPSLFSLAQATQICAGFAEVSIDALIAGSKNAPYAPFEDRARKLAEGASRLPFVREAGAKPVQAMSTLFATMIEDQYYITPLNRGIQLRLIDQVGKNMALDAMGQVCELKILEIRAK